MRKIYVLQLLAIFLCANVFFAQRSQSQETKMKYIKQTDAFTMKTLDKEELKILAQQNGWEMQVRLDDGTVIELQGITDEGKPLYARNGLSDSQISSNLYTIENLARTIPGNKVISLEKLVTANVFPERAQAPAPLAAMEISPDSLYAGVDQCSGTDTGQFTISSIGIGVLEVNIVANVDWITLSVIQDTIHPGNSHTYDAIFNGYGLPVGTYQGKIYIISNAALHTLDSIYCEFTVAGSPVLELSDTSYDFGIRSIDWLSTYELILYNTGCENINVSNITSSTIEFTVQPTSFTLLPYFTKIVYVTFAPTALINYESDLTIYNDFADTIVHLYGSGGEPPVMGVDTDNLSVAMSCKDTVITEQFTIENTGGSLLEVDFFATNGVSRSISTTLVGANNLNGTMFQIATNKSINISGIDIRCLSANTLYEFEVYYKIGTYKGYETDSTAWVLASITQVMSDALGNPTFVDIEDIFLPLGDYALYITCSNGYRISYNNEENIYSDGVVTMQTGIGKGYPFGSTFTPRTWNGTIYYNIKPDWLNFIDNDVIEASGSKTYDIEFNADGLESGVYNSDFIIFSNDSLHLSHTIACTLNVANEPEIALSDTLIEFGETLIGSTKMKVLTIINTGCDTLEGYLILKDVEFLLGSTDIELPVGDTMLVDIYYTPDDTGWSEAKVAILTNDVDTGIIITGYGVAAIIDSVTTEKEDGYYKKGEIIDLLVHYNSPVSVDTILGKPRINLNTTPEKYAEYFNGTGSDTLVFRYIVGSNENSDDLGYTSIHDLTLEGGTITLKGLVAGIELPVPDSFITWYDIVIDNASPTITLSTEVSSPTTTSPVEVTIEFSEKVNGFSIGDLEVVNGTADNFKVVTSKQKYTVDIIPAANGEVTVDVPSGSATDYAGNKNKAAKQLSFIFGTTGVTPEETVQNGLLIYPNPSDGEFFIEFSNSAYLGSDVSIIDITGRTVTRFKLTGQKQKIELDRKTEGVYLVKMVAGEEIYNYRLVIQ